MENHLISIILPVYNQALYIRDVVKKYQQSLEKIPGPYEIILVTNACKDNSVAICETLKDEYASVKVINSVEGGWGRAVKLGLDEAQGSLLCYTNSARTSPEDIVLLILYAIANLDTIIKAERKMRDNWTRRLGSLLYNLECRSLFDLSYWDINGTPKVFPRKFSKLLSLTRNDDLIDLEFNIICKQENYPVLSVPIFSTKNHEGGSTTNFNSALKMYWGAYQMWKAKSRGDE